MNHKYILLNCTIVFKKHKSNQSSLFIQLIFIYLRTNKALKHYISSKDYKNVLFLTPEVSFIRNKNA